MHTVSIHTKVVNTIILYNIMHNVVSSTTRLVCKLLSVVDLVNF